MTEQRPFQPGTTQKITAGAATSAATSLGLAQGNMKKQVRIVTGVGDAYIAFGGSSVAATANDMLLKAGVIEIFTVPDGATHYAVLRASVDTLITITVGAGS